MFDTGTIAALAPFLMIVGIVWVRSKARIEEKRIAASAAAESGAAGSAALERIEDLEDRVRILERIVTDGGYDLAQKIEALRDERPIGHLAELERPEKAG